MTALAPRRDPAPSMLARLVALAILAFALVSFGGPQHAIATTTARFVIAAEAGGATTQVGRWMSQGEFDAMSNSGRVIEGGGGRTYVVRPPNPDAYPAGKGVYAEFDVPTSSLHPASKPEWAVIPGPNAGTTRYGPLPTEMPPATCIEWVCAR